MARIRFLPDELDVEALADETLLHASVRAGIPHTSLETAIPRAPAREGAYCPFT